MTQRRRLTPVISLVASILLLASLAAPSYAKPFSRTPAWGGLDSPLRPGASLGGYCTFNFAFYTPGTARKAPVAYIGTAGHCTDELGEIVEHPELGEIGEVVYDSDLTPAAAASDFYIDFSLIKIFPEFVSQTNPQVLGWSGPTRVATEEDLQVGDQVDVYGYGIGVGETEQTRPRYGFLIDWTDQEYVADMPAVNGDSGAPLLHHETGAALGIISRYGFDALPPSTDQGPRLPWILEEVAKSGFLIKLATVKQ